MQTLVVDHKTLEIITSLAQKFHTSNIDVVQQAVWHYKQQTEKTSDLRKRKAKFLKIGKQRPFKPVNAIKMAGKGQTASEMVMQDRLSWLH